MASHAKQSIERQGFWKVDHKDTGDRVNNIVESGYQLEHGLDLCQVLIFQDSLVRDIIEAFFDKAVLGFYKVYGMMRDYHCILNHTPDLRILVVFACSRGSRLSILAGSFRHILYATEAPNGLLRVPDDVSHFEGVTATQEEMEHGGIVVLDARSGFKVLRGKAILIGLMVPDEAKEWTKMGPVPKDHWNKVKAMEYDRISMNVRFAEPENS